MVAAVSRAGAVRLAVLALALAPAGACERIAGVRDLTLLADAGPTTCDDPAPAFGCGGDGPCTLFGLPRIDGSPQFYQISLGLAVRGSNVVWSAVDGHRAPAVMVMDLAGSPPPASSPCPASRCIETPGEGPTEFTFDDGGELYWTGQTLRCVRHMALDATRFATLGEDAPGVCNIMGMNGVTQVAQSSPVVVDQDNAYVILYGEDDAATGNVVAFSKSGADAPQAPRMISRLDPHPAGIAIDADYVYWGTCSGPCDGVQGGTAAIKRYRKSDGAIDDAFATCPGVPHDLAISGGYLYWVSLAGSVCRKLLSEAGGAGEPIGANMPVQSVGGRNRLAVDESGGFVYWTSNAEINRAPITDTPKDGSTSKVAETFVVDGGGVFGIAVGCSGIYWTDSVSMLQRKAKSAAPGP
jgi:hypothetical protein